MNQLTPEQLDMLTRLQPLFKEKMGKWQEGDECYDVKDKECEWVEAYVGKYLDANDYLNCIRIPKPIDWQNSERGLWGMIDWKKLDGYITHKGDIYFQDGESDDADPFTAMLKALCEQEGV